MILRSGKILFTFGTIQEFIWLDQLEGLLLTKSGKTVEKPETGIVSSVLRFERHIRYLIGDIM